MHIDPSPAFVVHCVHTTAASPTRGEAILLLVRFAPQGGREFQAYHYGDYAITTSNAAHSPRNDRPKFNVLSCLRHLVMTINGNLV